MIGPSALVAAAALSLGAPAPSQQPADSVDVLRGARRAQARFERVRRDHLPWTWGGGGGECDERIGRYCMTHTDEDERWDAPPEDEAVIEARRELLAVLDAAARAVPGDGWIAGHRVRYLGEAERHEEAVRAARECAAERAWCLALEGYARHRAADREGADSLFAAALDAMPEARRREWLDPSLLLRGRLLSEYRELDPAGRERWARDFWARARPLYLLRANPLLAEHLSRHVLAGLQQDAEAVGRESWGDDEREILLRHGWPSGWERVRYQRRPTTLGPTPLVTHYDDEYLLPPSDPAAEWGRETGYTRSDHPLPDLDLLRGLEHQLAVLRRGDSLLVVAAYTVPRDSLPAGTRLEAALAFLRDGEREPRVARVREAGDRGAMTLALAPGAGLLSVEVLAPGEGKAMRWRRHLTLPAPWPGVAASDLVLLDPTDEPPESLEAALAVARTSHRVRPGERLGVYWEVHGLPRREEDVEVTLRVLRAERGWLRRLAEETGLVDRVPPVRLRWRERSAAPVMTRALEVQLPELSPGSYRVELTLAVPGRDDEIVVEREIQVVGDP